MKPKQIEALLPELWQRTLVPDSPLASLLAVMSGMLDPAERAIERLPYSLLPYYSSDEFALLLAYVVDLDRLLSSELHASDMGATATFPAGIGRLRELIRAAPELARWRGTTHGLRSFLEIATGIEGFIIEEGVQAGVRVQTPFHMEVRAPMEARVYEELVTAIIAQEKPAYVTARLSYHAPAHAGSGID